MRVRWTRPALADLEAIEDYIAADNPDAAYRLVGGLIDRVDRNLSHAPSLGREGRVSGTREFVTPGLPYIVVYRVREAVEIIAVRHTARKWPGAFGD